MSILHREAEKKEPVFFCVRVFFKYLTETGDFFRIH